MVTSLYAGILALFFIALSYHVVLSRREYKVAMGDAQNQDILRRIRAQGNFVEYSVFFLLLLGFAELNHLPVYILHTLGIVFVIGRIMHAYSLLKAEHYVNGKLTAMPVWRLRGMLCTLLCLLVLALISIWQFIEMRVYEQ